MKALRFLIFCILLNVGCLLMAADVTPDDVVIVFDNDVHGHVEGYPKISALKHEMLRKTKYVTMVSLGDYAQGGALTSISHGQYAVDIMNRVGYDIATIGNHEFDYGLDQLKTLTDCLSARTIVSNYRNLRTGELVFAPYCIRRYGQMKVGFIGAVAPITQTSDSPQSFVDDEGNEIYNFGRPDFIGLMQQNINEVRRLGADVVVLLAHLGDTGFEGETSEDVIRQTRGLNVVLDGHAHHVIPQRALKNMDGEEVLLCSSGSHFENIGRLIIHPDKSCQTDLIATKDYLKEDLHVRMLIDEFRKTFDHLPAIATSPYDLAAFDKEHDTYDRALQTNLGSLCADAFRMMSRADIGWINAGGIRASIPAGKITFKELLAAFPFENQICVAEFTGQRIIDALEFGVCVAPEDNGSYPQVSGLRFDLDLSVKANITTDAAGNLISVNDGPRRVRNVRVLNAQTNQYEPIDPKRNYSIASINFILKNHGCNGMLADGNIVADDQMVDTQLLEQFLTKTLGGSVGIKYSVTKQNMR